MATNTIRGLSIKEYRKQYYENNKDKIKGYCKSYYERNKEKVKKYQKEYAKAHPEVAKAGCAKYYKSHKEQISAYYKEYVMRKPRTKKKAEATNVVSANETLAVPALSAESTEKAHSMVSPSSLERVCNCPASVAICKDMPDVESEVAKEGTEFHAAMEDLLRNPPEDDIALNERINKLESIEMQNYVRDAYDYISGILVRLHPEKLEIETKLPAVYSEQDFGTIDVACLYSNDDGTHNVLVLDWKYGKGHFVEVDENKQLLSYALSYVHHAECAYGAKIKFVTTVIYQPRLPADDGKIARSKTYDLNKLNQLALPIKEKVALAYKILNNENLIDENLKAGKHCLFCKAKTTCKKYNEFIMQDVTSLISDLHADEKSVAVVEEKEEKGLQEINFKDINTLNADEILKVITFGETILPKLKSYIEDVMILMQTKLEAGEKVEGLKLVRGRGRRKWIDDEKLIIETLEKEGVEASRPTLKTLTEIEAALKSIGRKDLLDSLVVMSEGKARVALEDDKRKEISESLISDL